MSRQAQEKAAVERIVFAEFAKQAKSLGLLDVDFASISSCQAERPDIDCQLGDGTRLQFELVEYCDPVLAAAVSALKSNHSSKSSRFIMTKDPTSRAFRKKLETLDKYRSSITVHLLCYRVGCVITADDQILMNLEDDLSIHDPGRAGFTRVWFWGDAVGDTPAVLKSVWPMN